MIGSAVTALVEILQIQRIVPDLIDVGSTVIRFADFELDGEDERDRRSGRRQGDCRCGARPNSRNSPCRRGQQGLTAGWSCEGARHPAGRVLRRSYCC